MCPADQCSTQLPESLGIVSGKMNPDDREGSEASKGAASEPVPLGSAALCFCSHQVVSYMHPGHPVSWALLCYVVMRRWAWHFGFCSMEHKHYDQYGENQIGSSVLKLSLSPALAHGQWDPGWD